MKLSNLPVLAAAFAVLASPIFARTAATEKTDTLFNALGLPEMLDVIREEGLAYGASINDDMLGGMAGDQWPEMVSAIYDLDAMQTNIREALEKELEGDDVDAMLAFFTSEPGRTIINLEVSARRAMLDDAVEEASKESAAIEIMDETPRYQLVKQFIEVNDLIEANVVGALNSNYAFYMGLLDGGAGPGGLTADQALQDVWMQEPEIRATTIEWAYAFLLLSYQPLSQEDLETYIAFSATEAGQDLNNAMFLAFDTMFENISRGLGLASSQFMVGQDL